MFASMFFIRLIDRFRIQDAIFFILFSLLLVATQHRGDGGFVRRCDFEVNF